MKKRMTIEEFVVLSNDKHNFKYDYSRVQYKNCDTAVEIICPVHGSFMQRPYIHIRGSGCGLCSNIEKSKSRLLTTEDFIRKAMATHGDRYDYSKVLYSNAKSKVTIGCKMHGYFSQSPTNHLAGKGCRVCAFERVGSINSIDTDEFIKRAKGVHGDLYSYDKTIYTKSGCNVIIGCKEHGYFGQIANVHLSGGGCGACGVHKSKGESEIFSLVSSHYQDTQSRVRNIISPYELDIYIPSINLAIEFNGVYWHSTERKEKGYHQMKRRLCEDKGIRLISVNEWDWLEKRGRIERIILSAIGKNNNKSAPARKCLVVGVSTKDYRAFMNDNHIQGYAMAKYKFGLAFEDEIVAVMSFNQLKSGSWDMVRYATSCNVQGGQSKLFKYASSVLNMSECQSFVDCDFFTGSSYSNSGFVDSGDEVISFRVWHRNYGFMSRQSWWKANIPSTLKRIGADESIFSDNKTQNEMMKEAGCLIVENSGTKKFLWKRG